MTFEESLREAKKIGASKVEGLPLLAQTIACLARIHAINPRLVYEGAIRRALTAPQVRKLDPVGLGDLMFD